MCIVNVWIMMCVSRKCMGYYAVCIVNVWIMMYVFRKCMDYDVCVSKMYGL